MGFSRILEIQANREIALAGGSPAALELALKREGDFVTPSVCASLRTAQKAG